MPRAPRGTHLALVTRMHSRTYLLGSLLFALACTGCTGAGTASTAQMITCSTDPGTGVVTKCETGSGSGGANECHDLDEDGDGEPHDVADDNGSDGSDGSDHHGSGDHLVAPDNGGSDDGSGSATDSDHDGIPDSEDCDLHPGEDDNPNSELPYDIRPALGATTQPIRDAFAEQSGVQPASIDAVTMDGGTWRLAELQAGTAFLVSEDDCTHAGNRDIGRDRVIVTWRDTASAATQVDHLDIRYCNN